MERLDELRGVPLSSLRRYLEYSHWVLQPRAGRKFELYQRRQDDSLVEIILPAEVQVSDLRKQMSFAVRTLSQFEDRTIEEIIADVRSMGVDVLRPRLPDQIIRHDSVEFEIAEPFIVGLKSLLAASATTEIRPDRFFGRNSNEGLRYAEQCRFGHTFRGSFGFTIESPISPNVEPALPGEERAPPFERRVVQRIARGLRTIEIAGREGDARTITEAYRTGFNANMCEEFAALLRATGGASITFDVVLSPDWPAPEDLQRSQHFEARPQAIELVEEAAKRLRQTEFDRNRVIVGRVIRLKSDSDPSDLLNPAGSREITMLFQSADLGELKVKTFLRPEDYLLAVDAHKNGRTIRVRGVLDKPGKSWILSEPRDVGLVE